MYRSVTRGKESGGGGLVHLHVIYIGWARGKRRYWGSGIIGGGRARKTERRDRRGFGERLRERGRNKRSKREG